MKRIMSLVVACQMALQSSAPGQTCPEPFQQVDVLDVAVAPSGMAVADLDGDCDLDIALTQYAPIGGSVVVMLNDGQGSFPNQALPSYSAGDGPTAIASGDLNNDGYSDLVVINQESAGVSVLFNNGDGTMTTQIEQSIPNSGHPGFAPISVAVGDVNNDGHLDFAVAVLTESYLIVFINNDLEPGLFAPVLIALQGGEAHDVVLADLNTDSVVDIVVSHPTQHKASVLLNDGLGAFPTQAQHSVGNQPGPLAVGDLNGDGSPDIAVGSYYPVDPNACANVPCGHVTVLSNNGSGGFNASTTIDGIATNPQSMALADLDGDDDLDLAVTSWAYIGNPGSEAISVYLNGGNGSFPNLLTYGQLEKSWGNMVVAELDGTFGPEIIAAGAQTCDGSCSDSAVTIARNACTSMTPSSSNCLSAGQTVVLNPENGGGSPIDDPLAQVTNASGPDGATVTATVSPSNVHPHDPQFAFVGGTLSVNTSLDNGDFFMTVSMPITDADLQPGTDPLDLDLYYFNTHSERWDLAASGNTLPSAEHAGSLGERHVAVAATEPPPMLDDLHDRELGDYGVFWDQAAQVGFVWANVDHMTDFGAGTADCNGNGVPDVNDIAAGMPDSNGNGRPDECDLTLYVDNSNLDCTNRDGSQGSPFCTLQDAVAAAEHHSIIEVADGTYAGVSLSGGSPNVTLRSENGRDNCIIDAAVSRIVIANNNNSIIEGFTIRDGQDVYGAGILVADHSYPVIRACTFINNEALGENLMNTGLGGAIASFNSGLQVIDCSFSNNQAATPHSEFSYSGLGGAIYSADSTITIRGCEFSNNFAGAPIGSSWIPRYIGLGGAVYAQDSIVSMDDCVVVGNSADGPTGWGRGEGGGVFLHNSDINITACEFSLNDAPKVGALGLRDCTGKVQQCTFRENTAAHYAAAVEMNHYNETSPQILDCEFVRNVCSPPPGYDYGTIFEVSGNLDMVGCRFRDHDQVCLYVTGASGGAPQSVTNCAFHGNPDAILNGWSGTTTITNCTITDGTIGIFDVNVTIQNSIVWNGGLSPGPDGHFHVSNSNIQMASGVYPGIGNINADPLFVDPDGADDDPSTTEDNDYRLSVSLNPAVPSSPCLDAGDNSVDLTHATFPDPEPKGLPDTDIIGNVRIVDADHDGDADVDMGAYEFPENELVEIADPFQEEVIVYPGGGAADLTQEPQVMISNTNHGNILVSETPGNPHPDDNSFAAAGSTLTVETTLAPGTYKMTLSIPFTASDLPSSVPLDTALLGLDLDYYDTSTGQWELAVDANYQNSPNPVVPWKPKRGQRHMAIGAEPSFASLHALPIGDYGLFWNDAGAGFVWANVDHTTDYAVGWSDCNHNSVPDFNDIESGTSFDADGDGRPDECEAPAAECNLTASCADSDGDGVRDDACVWSECAGGTCIDTPLNTFADMGGAFGECSPDQFANIHDRNHALACFAGTNSCDSINVDAGGAFGGCAPDGFCNIHDANHALAAFAGTSTCACPAGPAPQFATAPVGEATVRLWSSEHRITSGGEVDVEIFIDGPVEALRSYQLDLEVTGGRSGELELVGIFVEDRKDEVFARRRDVFNAVNRSTGQILSGLEADEGVPARKTAYLATFTYRASGRARGEFVIDLASETYLVAPGDGEITVMREKPVVVTISGRR
jgi:hypothetical protein